MGWTISALLMRLKTAVFIEFAMCLRCHLDELVTFVDDFDTKPDVIDHTETWLAEKNPVGIYRPEGYHPIISRPRSDWWSCLLCKKRSSTYIN